ncbi:hypothetical protein [Mucilaginibacter humi]|nr:hypothetical protein [Mucilaginibacter humi]
MMVNKRSKAEAGLWAVIGGANDIAFFVKIRFMTHITPTIAGDF